MSARRQPTWALICLARIGKCILLISKVTYSSTGRVVLVLSIFSYTYRFSRMPQVSHFAAHKKMNNSHNSRDAGNLSEITGPITTKVACPNPRSSKSGDSVQIPAPPSQKASRCTHSAAPVDKNLQFLIGSKTHLLSGHWMQLACADPAPIEQLNTRCYSTAVSLSKLTHSRGPSAQ
jgi:hypothetical protein